MSGDDHDGPRFDRIADKAVAETGKVRGELGRGLARASAKDPRVLSSKALARLGPEGATAFVDELRRVFERRLLGIPDAAAKATKAGSKTPPLRFPRPPETIEGWGDLRREKRSPVAAGVMLGLVLGSVLLIWSTLWLAPVSLP